MASEIKSNGRGSVRLVLSYIIDWIIIIAIAAVGAGFSVATPNKRPFDVTDADISFPYVTKEKVSTGLLVAIGLVVPAIITFIVCLAVVPGPAFESASRSKIWKRKIWEWNAAWMGLGLSLAIAFMITSGTKNLVGKPRPNMLARCEPDLSRLLNSTVGGIGNQVDEGINLVSWTICRNSGSTLDDGFRSFPSGHSSFSFAGLTYFALFLCTKLAVTIPFLNYQDIDRNKQHVKPRKQAAAPPTYLIIFPLVSISAAIYISSTRYSDFMHHGFDIISGAILGIVSAWLGFRWYHLPISRGGGWAWAPRSSDRSFRRGIGLVTYASDEKSYDRNGRDLECGPGGEAVSDGNGTVRPYKTSEGSEGIALTDLDHVQPPGVGDSSRRSFQ
ncbi:hypothetical protein HO173_003953 [Letharia columbiana]|uniref:Phosphatidic acid phosphatase type 2/haloperoxidase domain-containing protein n=1 Tax=Letharia columbiana TaxID=112416 RepID=A0A8H6FZI4_9LECA|nr:uncharacterized protein HO173_003953 [Letharia columbiana]KAF6237752.1 hypothetical protein HO173_003953 [Letharia columbiana]